MSGALSEHIRIEYWAVAHDGPGWYVHDDEYPEEGSAGAFSTYAEACIHAEVHWSEPEDKTP